MAKLLIDSDRLLELVHVLANNQAEMVVSEAVVVDTEDATILKLLRKLGAKGLVSPRQDGFSDRLERNRGLCRTCGKERELAKDGECKICKMQRSVKKKAASEATSEDEKPSSDEPPGPDPGQTAPETQVAPELYFMSTKWNSPVGKGGKATATWDERPERVSESERRLQENIDRVVQEARQREAAVGIELLPRQRKLETGGARKLG